MVCQTITSHSSTKAEIFTTKEHIKALLQLSYMIEELNLFSKILHSYITLFNDNSSCANNSRRLQICKNTVQESAQSNFIAMKYIDGNINSTDLSTKEAKILSILSTCGVNFYLYVLHLITFCLIIILII